MRLFCVLSLDTRFCQLRQTEVVVHSQGNVMTDV